MLKVTAVGIVVGFLGGLFGKGGSAVATPMLQLVGIPAFFAIASPLPAAIPSTLIATIAYWRTGHWDRAVVGWTVASGVPLTIIGSELSAVAGGRPLLIASDALVLALGMSFLIAPMGEPTTPGEPRRGKIARVLLIGGAVGLLSGLLANSGGFLFAPLYARVLRLPLKTAFACSLVASAVLALPGTVVHVWLGHVSWPIVLALAAGSLPLSYLGAHVAIRMRTAVLEPVFGVALAAIGIAGVVQQFRVP